MIPARSQQEAIAFLADPASHDSKEPVERIETHISRIFLTGDRTFKLKRPVHYPYVDFSTPELRLKACEKEVELNALTAPGLYLGVRRIIRGVEGKLHLDGEYIADCWDDEHLNLLGQFRDTPIRVREGDAVGYGIMESIVTGEWPELGLTAESDRDVRNA